MSIVTAERAAVQHSWMRLVVDHLRVSKAEGFGFDTAWSMAAHAVKIPADASGGYSPKLFDEHGDKPETVASFFHEACRKAYCDLTGPKGSGDGPALRHFSTGMLDDDISFLDAA